LNFTGTLLQPFQESETLSRKQDFDQLWSLLFAFKNEALLTTEDKDLVQQTLKLVTREMERPDPERPVVVTDEYYEEEEEEDDL
jgi:hypothetical protein